jgi:hypothetical protein
LQGLWDKNCDAAPDSREGSLAEEEAEEEVVSSPRNDVDETGSLAINPSLEGKIHEPRESDGEDSDDESAEDKPVEGGTTAPHTLKRQAVAKQSQEK